MNQQEPKRTRRYCFVCEQPFEPGARHQLEGDRLLTVISSHMRANLVQKLVTKSKVTICCRHFLAGHPAYMIGEDSKLSWLKKEDVLNVQGPLLYCCPKAKRASPDSQPVTSSAIQVVVDDVQPPDDQPEPKKPKSNEINRHGIKPSELKDSSIPTEVIRLQTFSNLDAIPQILKSVSILKLLLSSPDASISIKDVLILLEAFQDLVVNKLSGDSHRKNLEVDVQSLQSESEKKERELQIVHSAHQKSLGWSLEAVCNRNELFFWSGFPVKEILVEIVIPEILQSRRSSGTEIHRSRGQHGLLTNKNGPKLEDRCLWIFMLLWRDFSFKELYSLVVKSNDYRGCFSSFVSLMKSTARVMGENARKQIEFPPESRWEELNTCAFSPSFSYQNRKFIVLDGTSLPIYQPKRHSIARSTWVHYKKHQAYRYLVGCTLDGSVIFISDLYPGVVPDDTIYQDSSLKQILTERYGTTEGRFGLMGDKGFIGVSAPENWVNLLTVSAQRELTNPSDQTLVPTLESILQGRTEMRQISPDQEFLTSTDVAKPRGIVETTIGKIKRFRKLTAGHIRSADDSNFLLNLVYISAYITNLQIQKRISLKRSEHLPSISARSLSDSLPSPEFSARRNSIAEDSAQRYSGNLGT